METNQAQFDVHGAQQLFLERPRRSKRQSELLEDFREILKFDHCVQIFKENPVNIEYSDDSGGRGEYTPDVFIKYRWDFEPASLIKPRLCAVMYRADIKKQWYALKPRFKAALDYASARGMEFKIFTEKEIQTEYMLNARFLNRYRDVAVLPGYVERLDNLLDRIPVTTPQEIIQIAARDFYQQAHYLFVLWHMVSLGLIGVELTYKLTMKTPIWSKSANNPVFVKPLKLR
ncbi:TnsA endonuclease N-terminal domain-containing protein [Dyadobacter sp. BHUBP1]|uniref:TnsA endonuclease N-terminal domain-containing protein n=1 Tax=Dyadobacter sp. BHUBP1 TaxID=3424178 RepID=UPI003D325799